MSTRRACIAHLQPRLRKVLCLTCTAVQVNGNPCFSPPKHLRSYFNPPSFGHVVSFILHFTMPTGLNLLTTDVATWFSDGPTVLSPSWEHEALAYIQEQILQGCLAATLSSLLFRCRYVPGFHLLHFTADHLGACCNWEQIKAVHLWSTAAQKQKCSHCLLDALHQVTACTPQNPSGACGFGFGLVCSFRASARLQEAPASSFVTISLFLDSYSVISSRR